MTENMAGSRFRAARTARQTHEVVMDTVKLLVFSQDPNRPAIGTKDLNSCTAVAIVSPYAAILAHIPPQPYPTDDPNLGMWNVQSRMNGVIHLYHHNRAYFPPNRTYSIVVGGTYNSDFVLYDQVKQIRDMLRQNHLEPMMKVYEVHLNGHASPAQGTVFIDARSGSPIVFVEDEIISG